LLTSNGYGVLDNVFLRMG